MNYLKTHLAFMTIITLVIIVLALSGYILFDGWQKKHNSGKKTSSQEELVVLKNEVSTNKLPDQFPTTVPIESGAEITQNYNASTPDGRFQSTRAFVTTKSLADNLKTYQDYLKSNGWKVLATIDEETYKMILGTKDQSQLQVSISENTISKVKTVDISLTMSNRQIETLKK